MINKGIKPNCAAGHSLGEYTALTLANSFDFRTGLELVKIRANGMQDACKNIDGSMAAIIGLDAEMIEKTCSEQNSPLACA